MEDLKQRAVIKARAGVRSLLLELSAERGMGCSDIARMVGASVSTVRKWRTGGEANLAKRELLATLAAFLDMLSNYAIEDPVQWMELPLPLPTGYRVRPMDVYKLEHVNALLDFANQKKIVTDLMDEVDPTWRVTRRSEFEVFQAPDGDLAIRPIGIGGKVREPGRGRRVDLRAVRRAVVPISSAEIIADVRGDR